MYQHQTSQFPAVCGKHITGLLSTADQKGHLITLGTMGARATGKIFVNTSKHHHDTKKSVTLIK